MPTWCLGPEFDFLPFMSRQDCIRTLRAASPAILPSLLLCDFANLEQEIRELEFAGFAALHLDVMDGVFVPNFSYGLTIVEAIRNCTELPLDVHLMMIEPQKYIRQFRDAGANSITIHAEATENLAEVLKGIRDLDAVAGVAINPATPVAKIQSCIELADLVLVMSVNAGFGGQKFDESVLSKLDQVRAIADSEILLEIDGGINQQTIASAGQHGVDLFVAGSAIFHNNNYKDALTGLSRELEILNENY